ncbi:MAG TPA: amidohydrolase family protein [Gemmatimonadales bacterium]|nr:amidohydrolase family protein [Gemmatimonadales bacterium]
MLPLLALLVTAPGPDPRDSSTVVILHGRYLDVDAGVLKDNGALVLRAGRIAEMHPAEDGYLPPSGATVRDASGQTILPGLIDAHVHLTLNGDPAANARATLRAGFTTVVDLGSVDGAGVKLRDAIRAGEIEGPRVIAAGSWIGATHGVCEFGRATVSTPAEAEARARADVAAGAEILKVCVTGWPADAVASPDSIELKSPLLAPVLKEAKRARKPVYAHAIGEAGALLAARSGVRALAHTPVVDSAGATQLAKSGVYLISTLATLGQGQGGDQVRASFSRLTRAGIPVVLGTDAGVLPHGENARELVALTEGGLTPIEALRAATSTAARLLERTDLGRITRGATADLVVVPGDPLADVAVLAHPSLVISGGRVVN